MAAEDFPLALRGVYAQPYTIRGRREFVAVAANGEHVASRLVGTNEDPAGAIADLWAELNEADPILPHQRPPSLHLVR
jgi:hypothetical protein